jgi:hypothetical protein
VTAKILQLERDTIGMGKRKERDREKERHREESEYNLKCSRKSYMAPESSNSSFPYFLVCLNRTINQINLTKPWCLMKQIANRARNRTNFSFVIYM